MYAKIRDNEIIKYPYNYDDLQKDNPYTNFNGLDLYNAFQSTEQNNNGFNLIEIKQEQIPFFDSKTQKISFSENPIFDGNDWIINCVVINKTLEELTQQNIEQAKSVRNQRNTKLSESDWTQVADAPVDKALWATYRQALRDITTQTGFPWEITWPDAP
jgi:hypothetical protein